MTKHTASVNDLGRLRHYPLSTIHNPRRRGVTLLLVLGLMAMFAMLVVAFMTVVTLYRSASETAAKIGPMVSDVQTIVSGKADTDAALLKLLVGDKLQSVMATWSVLEDMYGHPAFGTNDPLSGTFPTGNNGMRQAKDYDSASAPNIPGIWMFNDANLSLNNLNTNPGPLELAGSVLTVTGIAANKPQALLYRSFRIYKIHPAASDCLVYIVPPIDEFAASDFDNCSYVINGAAFSGTGPGFNPQASGSAQLTAADGDSTDPLAYAVRPNVLAPNSDGATPYKDVFTSASSLVMLNSDYTAPDYQHPFLAWLAGSGTPATVSTVVPSFLRPNRVEVSSTTAMRKTVLRPLPHDHPEFDGSNPRLDLTNFQTNIVHTGLTNHPWDVDNDNDGVPDSIWIDAGLGVYVDPKTNKTYKRLVSYLVVDMDGRLNVNVHGNAAQSLGDFASITTSTDPMQSVSVSQKIRGSGNGPAEVRLDKGLTLTEANKLMFGDSTKSLPGRYNDPGSLAGTTLVDKPGPTTSQTGDDDPVAVAMVRDKMGVDTNAYDYINGVISSGTYPDWWGQSAMSFDPLGNRFFKLIDQFKTEMNALYRHNPYMMNPYGKGNDDLPFDAEQLEAVLRTSGDADFANLPQRLRDLLGNTPGATSRQRLDITTRSSDLASPSRFMGINSSNQADWSIYRKILRAVSNDTDKAAILLKLLPIEIRQGLRVNLNRPSLSENWINPYPVTDTVNYPVVHVKGLKERARFAQEIFYLLVTLCYDEIETGSYTEGGLTSKADVYTRLAQWSVNLVDFMDPDATMTPFVFSIDPFQPNPNDTNDTNVPYDNVDDISTIVNNGTWPPPGPTPAPNSNLRLIWGMEKPEVAITETLGTHNRCVADSDYWGTIDVPGNNGQGQGGPGPGQLAKLRCERCTKSINRVSPGCSGDLGYNNEKGVADMGTVRTHDEDFDQTRNPEPSLFIEIYRCGNPGQSHLPPEFAAASDSKKLDLAKTTGNGDCIWRLAISEKAQKDQSRVTDITQAGALNDLLNDSSNCAFQPKQWPSEGDEDGNVNLRGDRHVGLERFVWFGAAPANSYGITADYSYANIYPAAGQAQLGANDYLVLGPREEVTSLLSKPVNGTSQQDFGVPDADPKSKIDLKNITAPNGKIANWIVAKSATAGVNISQAAGTTYTTGHKSAVADTGDLKDFGTIPCARAIFLQRLADPVRAHNPVTNPYITVDWNMVDLHIFSSELDSNGLTPVSHEPGLKSGQNGRLAFETRQWGTTGQTASTALPNIWDRNIGPTVAADPLGGLSGTNTVTKLDANATFGGLNKFVNNVAPSAYSTFDPVFKGAPANPFVAFAWNDAPFANAYEVIQVPASTPGRFGLEFHDKATAGSMGSLGTGQRFRSEGDLGYLLSFESSGTGSLNLTRFLELVGVPSRFNGTIVGWIPAIPADTTVNPPVPYTPPRPIYSYQEPGKINLNTATEAAWKGLKGDRTNASWPDYTTDLQTQLAAQPFRSSSSVDLVPTGISINPPVKATLLGQGSAGLFFKTEQSTSSNMINEYENAARLSSMTTNRSNVFAVWITVGYFEVTKFDKASLGKAASTGKPEMDDLWYVYPDVKNNFPKPNETYPNVAPPNSDNAKYFDAVYPDGYVLGREKGLDDGTVKRHRSFAIIDRTIPVGFRRGEKMNAENIILLQRTLE